jgi:glycine/D-amino acid oxidase-like deaminating enzyme
MPEVYDLLIIGRGIAGAVLAETAMRRGFSVLIFDRKREGNASMAAAGVVNPVVLRRDVPTWRAAEMLHDARGCYTAMEERLGERFWHPMGLVKIFPTPKEKQHWERAMSDPNTAPFIDQRPAPEVDAAPISAPNGYGTVIQAAWLDVPRMLDAQRTELLRNKQLTEIDVTASDIIPADEGVRIGDVQGHWLVRCEGPFAKLSCLTPVKGETLIVRIPGLRLTRMVHRGVFLLPLGEERYCVGSTYTWENLWEGKTEEARRDLLKRLSVLVDAPVEVLDQHAGVRPAAKDRRPIMGITAAHEAVLNGLGSRGVMLAPWCAEHLCEHLFDGKPLDTEVDLGRFASAQ